MFFTRSESELAVHHPSLPHGKQWWILGAIVLGGFALRLYRLDHQSLWFDEALTIVDSRLPTGEITEKITTDFAHPPLHHYILHFWFQVFGFGVFQARLFSAILGTLAIICIWLFARYLFDEGTGRLAALLLAISQMGVWSSQEARPYAMLLVLTVLAGLLFAVAVRQHQSMAWWSCIIVVALLVYTHYHAALLIIALAGYYLLARRRTDISPTWLVGGALLFLALVAPWVVVGLVRQTREWAGTLFIQQPPWFAVNWSTPLSTVNKFSNGKPDGLLASAPLWAILAGGALFTVPAVMPLKSLVKPPGTASGGRGDRDSVLLVAVLFAVPFALALGMGALVSLRYDSRYVLYCIAPYYILAARGLSQMRPALLRRGLLGAILLYSAYSLRANYVIPYKENVRDALAHLAAEWREGDVAALSPREAMALQWSIYQEERPPLPVIEAQLEELSKEQPPSGRVWLVADRRTSSSRRRHALWRRWLEQTHYQAQQHHFFWVDLELYVLRDPPRPTG